MKQVRTCYINWTYMYMPKPIVLGVERAVRPNMFDGDIWLDTPRFGYCRRDNATRLTYRFVD